MSRRKRNGVHPALAVAMLIAGGGVALWQFSSFGRPATFGPSGEVLVGDLPDDATAGGAGEAPGVDLLELHGSWSGASVRLAFRAAAEAQAALAAPAGETAGAGVAWIGDDPPTMRLGVVLISDASQRAVLDGRVVGIGDVLREAAITEIQTGVVRSKWRGRTLTYDLQDAYPREFRGEVERRRKLRAAAGDQPGDGAAANSIQEKGK
ncbi:MAG: hypothetical protein U1E73_13060 [Planctomycetota bacterium]